MASQPTNTSEALETMTAISPQKDLNLNPSVEEEIREDRQESSSSPRKKEDCKSVEEEVEQQNIQEKQCDNLEMPGSKYRVGVEGKIILENQEGPAQFVTTKVM